MPLITRRSIDARFAPRVGRQMRLDLRKLRFRQPKLVATHLCLLFGSRESRHYVRANTFMGPDPSAASQPAVASEQFQPGTQALRLETSTAEAGADSERLADK